MLPAQNEVRVDGAIHEDDVALIAHHHIGYCQKVVKAPIAIEPAILDDQRNVVDAILRWKTQ